MMLLFDKWDTSKIEVKDEALKPYISVRQVMVPSGQGRHAYNRFWAPKSHIVERLINRLQVSGHQGKKHKISSGYNTGKTTTMYRIVKNALILVEKKTGKNPVEVLVRAVENAAPREGITSIEYGGARYSKAVEVAPQRRIDLALRWLTQGAYAKSFGKKRKVEECLADEIVNVAGMDNKSALLTKKLELERQADSSR
tara:strand:- start:126 stop:719 length:594 start_codon:yes stop_codon:yes gene_type:complete